MWHDDAEANEHSPRPAEHGLEHAALAVVCGSIFRQKLVKIIGKATPSQMPRSSAKQAKGISTVPTTRQIAIRVSFMSGECFGACSDVRLWVLRPCWLFTERTVDGAAAQQRALKSQAFISLVHIWSYKQFELDIERGDAAAGDRAADQRGRTLDYNACKIAGQTRAARNVAASDEAITARSRFGLKAYGARKVSVFEDFFATTLIERDEHATHFICVIRTAGKRGCASSGS